MKFVELSFNWENCNRGKNLLQGKLQGQESITELQLQVKEYITGQVTGPLILYKESYRNKNHFIDTVAGERIYCRASYRAINLIQGKLEEQESISLLQLQVKEYITGRKFQWERPKTEPHKSANELPNEQNLQACVFVTEEQTISCLVKFQGNEIWLP